MTNPYIYSRMGEAGLSLIVPLANDGGYAVAGFVETDDDGDRVWVISSPRFATVNEAKTWIDAGCPDGTEHFAEIAADGQDVPPPLSSRRDERGDRR